MFFSKKRFVDGRRSIYLFGIKIFTYKHKKTEFIFNYIKQAWLENHGPTKTMLTLLRAAFSNSKIKDKIIWWYYILCLKKYGYVEEALRCLSDYVGIFGLADLHKILPLAAFAYKAGYKTDMIEKANFVYTKISDGDRQKKIEKFFTDKTIAIVGGSGCEIGLNKGKDIDKHDIVMRFNNYPQDSRWEKDYGNKTNVWVRQNSPLLIHKPDISEYIFVIWKEDMDFRRNTDEQINIMYDYLQQDKLFVIEHKYYQELIENYNIYRPTAGCMVIFWLYKILGGLKGVDVYGFSFLHKDYNDTKHYFDNVCNVSVNHDMKLEIDLLYNLYYGKSGEKYE